MTQTQLPPTAVPSSSRRAQRAYAIFILIAAAIFAYTLITPRPTPAGPAIFAAPVPDYANRPVALNAGEYPIERFLQFLSDEARVPIQPLWSTRDGYFKPDGKFRLIAEGTYPLTEALILVRQAINNGDSRSHFQFEFEPDRIIAGDEALADPARAETRIYPVGDLLQSPGLWVDAVSSAQSISDLSDTIRLVVESDNWRENGGTLGLIRPLGDRLFISATPAMHWQIEFLLTQLRGARGQKSPQNETTANKK